MSILTPSRVPRGCKWVAKGVQNYNVLRTVLHTVQGELEQSWIGERLPCRNNSPTKKKRQNCRILALG